MAYVIGSQKGKDKAEEMKSGESWYNTTDGSTWEKKADGSVSVTTNNGEKFDKAYTPSSNKNSQYTGSSTGIQTYNSSQEAIKNQMNQNSIAWWSADAEGKKVLEAQNRELAGKLGGNISFDPGTGTWSGAANNSNLISKDDILEWEKQYNQYNPRTSFSSSYDEKIDALLKEILNRDDFSYDVASDPLYQQYAQMYRREGDRAMRDTLAEVATGAGGMNSYAITAAQQANNYYNSQLNDKIPELYQPAYEMYLNDKESMVQDLGLLQSMDATQYNRYRDTINDWYNDKTFAYGAYQDAIEQGNWQTNFDYNAMWDNKSYDNENYWTEKNFDNNNYWAEKEFNANQADKEYDKDIYNKETAQAQINELIQYGELPSDDLLAQAGMDKTYALQLVNAVRRQLGLPALSSTSNAATYNTGGYT